jgi:hypothetical protein
LDEQGQFVFGATTPPSSGNAYTKSLNDNIVLSESFTKVFSIYKSLNESLSISELTYKLSKKSFNDNISNLDNINKSFSKSMLDSFILNDSLSKKYNRFIILNDGISTNDSVSKILNRFITLNDAINSNDSISKILNRAITLTDIISTSENIQRNGGNGKSLFDSVSLTDTIFKKLFKLQSDSIITGEVEYDLTKKNFYDAISQTDNITLFRGKAVNLFDSVAFTDSIKKALYKLSIDNFGLAEVDSKATNRNLSDIINPIDSILKNNGKAILLSDNVFMNDVLSKAIIKAKFDALIANDSIGKSINIGLVDLIPLLDKMTIHLPDIPEYNDIIQFILNITMEKSFNINIVKSKDFNIDI